MTAKDKPISKPMNKNYSEGYDRIYGKKDVPVGEDTRPKDRVKLGLSPSCVVEDINSEDLK